MATHRPITLLHISDIQVKGVDEEKMLVSLLHDLHMLTDLYGLKPQLIVASGDLAQEGKENEFERVAKFLNDVTKQLELQTENIIIVPGNHDINWASCKEDFPDTSSEPMPPYKNKWREFAGFFTKLHGSSPHEGFAFTLDQPWTLYEIPAIRTVFAGLNSTWEESHRKGKKYHYGFIGSKQIQWFENKLKQYKSDDWLRIAVLHHNVVTMPSDDSYLKDRGDFNKSILPLVNLVLHGHTHQGADDNMNGVPILSTGSAAVVAARARPPEVPNQYQIVQIWPTQYQRWARSYSKVRQNWIGDCSISTDGNSWNERKYHRFTCTTAAFPSHKEGFPQHAKGFIEAGDFVTADAIMSHKRKMESDVCGLDYFRLRQKFGVYDDEDLKLLDEKLTKMTNPKDRRESLLLQIVRLKLYSQQEKFDKVAGLYHKLMSELELLNLYDKQRGITHRQAISTAIVEGFEATKPIFSKAEEISKGLHARISTGEVNEHSLLTTKVLSMFAEFFCNEKPPRKEKALRTFIDAQQGYLVAKYEHGIGQAFPAKSAFQTLFAEAAVLLYSDLDDHKGWIRLFAAHLLISRYVITPRAEGYSEQLSMIYSPTHFVATNNVEFQRRETLRKLLESAMWSESSKRKKFLEEHLADPDKYRYFVQISEIFDLIPLQNLQPNDWLAFRDFLTEHDDRMSI